jgi:hypothetical protein
MTDLFAPTIANGEEKPSLEASDDKPYWHLPVEPAWLLS